MIWNGPTWTCSCGFVNAVLRKRCRNCQEQRRICRSCEETLEAEEGKSEDAYYAGLCANCERTERMALASRGER